MHQIFQLGIKSAGGHLYCHVQRIKRETWNSECSATRHIAANEVRNTKRLTSNAKSGCGGCLAHRVPGDGDDFASILHGQWTDAQRGTQRSSALMRWNAFDKPPVVCFELCISSEPATAVLHETRRNAYIWCVLSNLFSVARCSLGVPRSCSSSVAN